MKVFQNISIDKGNRVGNDMEMYTMYYMLHIYGLSLWQLCLGLRNSDFILGNNEFVLQPMKDFAQGWCGHHLGLPLHHNGGGTKQDLFWLQAVGDTSETKLQ